MDTNRDELDLLSDMSELDEQILARAGEEELSDRMKKEKDKKTEERAPWTRDFREHWFAYALLALSFLLTEMTAFYLGTSPTLKTNPDGSRFIEFQTDIGHLLTTLVYMLVFPVVTEVAFGYFRNKFDNRETGNFWQQVSAGLGAAIALFSIVGTGVSGAFVIFSTLGSVGFLEVPPSVQTYLIWIIPILLAIFGLLAWAYGSNSEEAQDRKRAAEDDRKAELNDRIRMSEIERAGRRAIRAEAIRVYRDMVTKGILSHREASEALSQGLSIGELEKKLRRDLTGEGKIGNTSGLNNKALASPPPPALPMKAEYKARWSLRSLLSYVGMDAAEAREMIRKYELFDARSAYQALDNAGYIPEGLDLDSFMPLFCELAGVAPTWDSIPTAFNPGIIPAPVIPARPINGNTPRSFQ